MSRTWSRVFALPLVLSSWLLPAPALAQGAGADDVLLAALKQELGRSVEKLALPGQEKPYYIEYAVQDVQTFDATAAFGALVQSREDRSRDLRVEVRVGGYDLDNSAFVGSSMSFFFGMRGSDSLVLEDDGPALRRDLWLATDSAYKNALEQLALKRAVLQNRVDPEPLPDFSREKPTVLIAPALPPRGSLGQGTELVRRLSALFRKLPALQESSVRLRAVHGQKYFVSSEGSVVRQPVTQVWLFARAATQASDGMRLKDYVAFASESLESLPSEAAMAAGIEEMARELSAAASARTVEKYVGPVLVTGQASAQLFRQVLASQLSGQRPPLAAEEQMAAAFPKSELFDRVKRPVLPAFLTVVDDPTRTAFAGQPLLGAYAVDDQGLPARPLALVEKGVLRGLLMSRRPSKDFPQSNGHARGGGFGPRSAQIGNLLVTAAGGKTEKELKQELLDLCKAQELPYGLLIRKLDVPAITGRDSSFSPFMMPSRSREALTAPLAVYKVYVEGGREELVRGASVGTVTVRTLKEITAAGKEPVVDSQASSASSGLGEPGPASSVAAPSVLFSELEVTPQGGGQQRPALIPHPSFKSSSSASRR